ncbi:T6SS phospholipase effector Tle1-like catalytic domain-containing protein [Phyllobacterium endophyticum]|uniref:T6SS phospholipase effector Tle1-like catalytic domain-containing protein n=1 Tax=Phyllobacterium endophyticum TaxID=1149773 RepID=UPI001475FC8C
MYRRVYNVISQATGLGLTGNVVDCYAAIIRMWEPGDRILLFGFSRGAYTVRCLGGALAFLRRPDADAGSRDHDFQEDREGSRDERLPAHGIGPSGQGLFARKRVT